MADLCRCGIRSRGDKSAKVIEGSGFQFTHFSIFVASLDSRQEHQSAKVEAMERIAEV
jgi:hypothetical protein